MAFTPLSASMPQLPRPLSGSQGMGGGLTDPEAPSGIPSIPLDSQSSVPSPPPMTPNAVKNTDKGMDDLYALDAKASFVSKLMKKLAEIPPEVASRAGIDPNLSTQQANDSMGLPPGSNAATVTNGPNGQASAPSNMGPLSRGMRMAANTTPGIGNG